MNKKSAIIPSFKIQRQPDDVSCGPTCLHALYRYYGDAITMDQVIREVKGLEGGGTLAVMLGRHALQRGYRVTIYTYNLQVFDPTWFREGINITDKILQQARHKKSRKLQIASQSYIEYLKLGGRIRFEDLTTRLLLKYLNRGVPILTGLSSTYLYRCPREYSEACLEDDVRGEPTGHFVILRGYDRETRTVQVSDPYDANPVAESRNYSLPVNRVIAAILLGILTYDANLLIVEPSTSEPRGQA